MPLETTGDDGTVVVVGEEGSDESRSVQLRCVKGESSAIEVRLLQSEESSSTSSTVLKAESRILKADFKLKLLRDETGRKMQGSSVRVKPSTSSGPKDSSAQEKDLV